MALMLLLTAACGGSPTASNTASAPAGATAAQQVYDQINGLSGSERTNTLLDLAKKDGTLSLYTSNTDMDDVVKAFEDKYGLKVQTYRANSETVLQRVLQEASANYQGADLIETNAGELHAMQQRQLLYQYQGQLREKGRGGLEIGDVDWFAAMYNYYKSQGSSDDEVMSFFRQLAANSKIAKGHTVMGELLAAGQFDVAASIYSHTVDNAAEKGAPVSWRNNGKPVEPVVLRPNGAGLMKSAKHPAAAMLFLDFLLTDGQKAIADANRIGAIPTAQDPLAGVQTVSVPEEELLNNPQKWSDTYKKVTDAGGQT